MRNIIMDKEIVFSSRASKKSPYVFWLVLLFLIMAFGVYICGVSLTRVTVPSKPTKISFTRVERTCSINGIPPEELVYVHFPQPKTYSREECKCTPVRFFVILSMQRSGSGWFETLLNSHPNISSNGEVFSLKQRRQSMETIQRTLDTIYNLEWISSAAKNDCVAAVGFKWMLNQAVMVYHRQIANYFNQKGVSVIFLFRRNLLRRLVSLLANAYDKDAKLINGTHMSHVHTREEADLLAQFKPTLNVSSLIVDLSTAERTMMESLEFFKSNRHMILYYEDIINNPKALSDVQEFLRVPFRKLKSRQVKIHIKPLHEQVHNWYDVYSTVQGSQYEHFLHSSDYIS
ncbi:nodulation protein H-like isoform X1 [Vitis riparia]|uniref:nodulation protein H-like isoform X1 n=2 Tax=Vitis riparia TaxID=96939 RepID=UPI00155AC968|nr:nodulation protein H-like isoform X1 [Vitis riparia]